MAYQREDEGDMLAILRLMQNHGGWMMARQIKADSTQYGWLLRRNLIHRRDAERYGSYVKPRHEYRISKQGLAYIAERVQMATN